MYAFSRQNCKFQVKSLYPTAMLQLISKGVVETVCPKVQYHYHCQKPTHWKLSVAAKRLNVLETVHPKVQYQNVTENCMSQISISKPPTYWRLNIAAKRLKHTGNLCMSQSSVSKRTGPNFKIKMYWLLNVPKVVKVVARTLKTALI